MPAPVLTLVPPPAPRRSPAVVIALAAFGVFSLGTALYPMLATSWSGHSVATFDVLHTPMTGSATAHAVGPVHLDPGMNPLRVLAHLEHPGRARASVTCVVTMRDAAGRTVWAENRNLETDAVGHSTRRASATTVDVERFDVERPGEYTFVVDAGAVRDLRLEVRSRVASVQWWFVGLGAALSLASLAAVVLTGSRGVPARQRPSAAA